MSIFVGQGSAVSQIQEIRSGPDSAALVMLGTGTEAREAWPVSQYQTVSIPFTEQRDVRHTPIAGFDARTSETSPLNTVAITNGVLTPISNTQPTHHYRLVDRRFTGNHLDIQTVVRAPVSYLTAPSVLVIGANQSLTEILGVEFGYDGVKLFYLTDTTYTFLESVTRVVTVNDVLRVVRLKDTVTVYLNGAVILSVKNSLFDLQLRPMVSYPGYGVYTNVGGIGSSAFGPLTIFGSTFADKEVVYQEWLRRVEIPQSAYTELCRAYIGVGGLLKLDIIGAAWKNGTTFSTRRFHLYLNGTSLDGINAQNGGDFTITTQVPDNSIIEVRGYSNAGANDRIVKGGRLLVSRG